jgi:hypothetical protein
MKRQKQMTTHHNTVVIVIIIFILLCVMFLVETPDENINIDHFVNKSDPYTLTDIKDDNTELLKLTNHNMALPANMYIKTEEFYKLEDTISDTIYNTIIKRAMQCGEIDRTDGVKVRPDTQLTLTCLTSPEELQDLIITNVTNLLIDYVHKKHQITLNEYYVASMMYTQLHLMDSLIYPLLMTKQYTLYGISYFTRQMVRQMINQNIKIHDILYTILGSRGIDVIRSSDDQR